MSQNFDERIPVPGVLRRVENITRLFQSSIEATTGVKPVVTVSLRESCNETQTLYDLATKKRWQRTANATGDYRQRYNKIEGIYIEIHKPQPAKSVKVKE